MWAGGSYQARARRIRRFSLTRQSYSGPKPQQISLIYCVERLFGGYEKAAAGMERCDGDEGRCNGIEMEMEGRRERGYKVTEGILRGPFGSCRLVVQTEAVLPRRVACAGTQRNLC